MKSPVCSASNRYCAAGRGRNSGINRQTHLLAMREINSREGQEGFQGSTFGLPARAERLARAKDAALSGTDPPVGY